MKIKPSELEKLVKKLRKLGVATYHGPCGKEGAIVSLSISPFDPAEIEEQLNTAFDVLTPDSKSKEQVLDEYHRLIIGRNN